MNKHWQTYNRVFVPRGKVLAATERLSAHFTMSYERVLFDDSIMIKAATVINQSRVKGIHDRHGVVHNRGLSFGSKGNLAGKVGNL